MAKQGLQLLFIVIILFVGACISDKNEQISNAPSSAPAILTPPANAMVQAGMPTVTVMWSPVPGAQQYNLYASTQPGINPVNWSVMPGGQKILDVSSPYSFNRIYNDTDYYFVVTAEADGLESSPSDEVVDSNQYIFDDFERPDQLLGGTAPTGQTWATSGPGSLTYGISNGRMVTDQNIYPSLPYQYHNFRFGASFSFSVTASDLSCIVLIAGGGPDGRALRNMVHLRLSPSRWGLLYRVDQHQAYTAKPGQTVFDFSFVISQKNELLVSVDGVSKILNVDYQVFGVGSTAGGTISFNTPLFGGEIIDIYAPGAFENITGGSYSLATDGTVYNAAMTIQGNTVTLDLPDGSSQQVSDNRIQSITGKNLIWQLTDNKSRNESVFATPNTN